MQLALFGQTSQDIATAAAFEHKWIEKHKPEMEVTIPIHRYDDKIPKVIANVYEALSGAIFLDCGKNLEILWGILKSDFELLSHKEAQRHIDLHKK